MTKEFIGDQLKKTELQPVFVVNDDVEAAATNGKSNAKSSDAMMPADVIDEYIDQNDWTEKHSVGGVETSFHYQREDFTLRNHIMDYVNTEKGKLESKDVLNDKNGASDNVSSNEMFVNHKYKADKKYQTGNKDAKPAFSDLVEQDANGAVINTLCGTLDFPNIHNELDKSSIFINNTTYADDIRQGSIGDCYFLAALLHIVQYDPSKIVSIMRCSEGNVSTTFYHKENGSWVPTTVQTKLSILKSDRGYGDEYLQNMGANVRINYTPDKCIWSSSIDGSNLKINKDNYFQAAMWVNCIEQAYEVFSLKYGQYGNGRHDNDSKNTEDNDALKTERIDAIEGGSANFCLHLFYGNQANPGKRKNIKLSSEKKDLFTANQAILDELLKFAKSKSDTADEHVFMTAHSDLSASVYKLHNKAKQLSALLESSSKDANSLNEENLKNAQSKLDSIIKICEEITGSGIDVDKIDKVDNEVSQLENNADFKKFNPSEYLHFAKIASSVVYCIDGKHESKRFLYSGHAYNIESVQLLDAKSNSLHNVDDVQNLISSLDLNNSSVTLQNPHGGNTPNIDAENAENANGKFTISLQDFFNHVDSILFASAKK